MITLTPGIKSSLLLARIKNIIYYRLEVEPKDPERIRCQYQPVLRKLRKDILDILPEIMDDKETYQTLDEVVQIIPPTVKTENCLEVIQELCQVIRKKNEENRDMTNMSKRN